jgi:hypothetical protein
VNRACRPLVDEELVDLRGVRQQVTAAELAPIENRLLSVVVAGLSSLGVVNHVPGSPRLGSLPLVARNHRDARWHQSKIHKIMSNPGYVGDRRCGEQVFPCLQIVPDDLLNKVQSILAGQATARVHDRGDTELSLLSGVFTCAASGGRFYRRKMQTNWATGRVEFFRPPK